MCPRLFSKAIILKMTCGLFLQMRFALNLVYRQEPRPNFKAAYGRLKAPLWWYKSVSNFLSSLGYTRMRTEPCIWMYFDDNNKPRSIMSGCVDEFLLGGSQFDNLHRELMAKIQRKFNWGTWEHTPFIQCGARITQHEDFGFTLDQEEFYSILS